MTAVCHISRALFKGNSKDYKISRRKRASHLHHFVYQTWNYFFFFFLKNSIKLLNIHYYGCRENVSLTSGFAPRAGYVFYSVALCYKTYKLPLVPEVVPHPSRAAPSSEVWDNQTPSYLYLTWNYSLLRKGSCIVMTDGQWYHQCCVSLS